MPWPVELVVADDSSSWESAGFAVDRSGKVRLGEVSIRLEGRCDRQDGGMVAWCWHDVPGSISEICGIPVVPAREPVWEAESQSPSHPNHAERIDHIVIYSGIVEECVRSLIAAGIPLLRQTTKVRKGMTQAIFRPSTAIIEIVGPEIASANVSPPQLWGLSLVTRDMDRTCAVLALKSPWPAVQPGRMMTTMDHMRYGMSVRVAFMTPHVRGLEGKAEERERLLESRANAQNKLLAQQAEQKAKLPGKNENKESRL